MCFEVGACAGYPTSRVAADRALLRQWQAALRGVWRRIPGQRRDIGAAFIAAGIPWRCDLHAERLGLVALVAEGQLEREVEDSLNGA